MKDTLWNLIFRQKYINKYQPWIMLWIKIIFHIHISFPFLNDLKAFFKFYHDKDICFNKLTRKTHWNPRIFFAWKIWKWICCSNMTSILISWQEKRIESLGSSLCNKYTNEFVAVMCIQIWYINLKPKPRLRHIVN